MYRLLPLKAGMVVLRCQLMLQKAGQVMGKITLRKQNAACSFDPSGTYEGSLPKNMGPPWHRRFTRPNIPHVSTAPIRFSALLLLFDSYDAPP